MLRSFLPGVPLHVIQRGNDRAPLFVDADDYDYFLECAYRATRRFGVAVHAYVLMTNHVHMLATPEQADSMARAMHWLGSVFVQQLNLRYGRSGSRVEGRYKARFIESEAHFLTCMRYIESNPVRAGMTPAPGDYRWSSYRANANGTADALVSAHPLFVALGASAGERRDAYRKLFSCGLEPSHLDAIRMPALRPGRRKKNGARPGNGV